MASILIVDDAAFMRMTIKKMVEAYGHTVVGEAGNGVEGISQYKALKPDVVFLDLTMPEMNGMETIKHIKDFDPHAKVIVCTAMGQQERIAQAIQNGAVDFIVKPFKVERIGAAVEKVLKM